jgi:alkylation response protein AidB-like acyl-CoA dehydrogenase
MTPFSAPMDDIVFCLTAVAGATQLPEWDADFATEVARHFAAFAEVEIAPLDAPGDAQGCSLVDGRVQMPDGFRAVYQEYARQGWPGLTAPEEFGGQNMDGLTLGMISEIFTGACHSLQMVAGLVPGAIRTVMRFGTDDQQRRFVPPLVSGETWPPCA